MRTLPLLAPGSFWVVLCRADDYVSPGGQKHPRYLVECRCGTKKTVVGHTLSRGDSLSCGCRRAALNTDLTHKAAHERLRTSFGKASAYACVDCGNQADDWSFKHPIGHSADASDYVPRCRSCHQQYDNRLLREAYARDLERQRRG